MANKAVQGICQVLSAGGGSQLVVDDADFLVLMHEADHGLDEVMAMGGVDPSGADDQGRFTQDPADGLFAGEFGFAVDV